MTFDTNKGRKIFTCGISVLRIAGSTVRVTQGKVYRIKDNSGSITDNNGDSMVVSTLPNYWIHKKEIQKKEKKKMVIIETVVLVNGERASKKTVNDIIELVEVETNCIKRIEALGFSSPKLDLIKKRHKKTCDDLLDLLPDNIDDDTTEQKVLSDE